MMNLLKKFMCKIGWHSNNPIMMTTKRFTGNANYVSYKCRWCGKIGYIDKNGNLI